MDIIKNKKYFDEEIRTNMEIKEINTFGKTKSKYLMELNMKVILHQTEYNDKYFVASISRESSFYHTFHDLNKKKTCYILTDLHLIIKNFTPNTSFLIGVSSDIMNNNIEITYYIRELYEEFLKLAVEINELKPYKKLMLKKKILIKKFSTPTLINWKRSDFSESMYVSTRIADILKRSQINSKEPPKGNVIELLFYMTVNEVIINGKTVGYIFKLEKPNETIKMSTLYKNSEIKYKKVHNLSNTILKSTIDIPKENNLSVSPDYVPISDMCFELFQICF